MLILATKVPELYIAAISLLCLALPSSNRAEIRQQARSNAKDIGLNDEEWNDYRHGSEMTRDLLMAFDPEGERRRLNKQQKQMTNTEDIRNAK